MDREIVTPNLHVALVHFPIALLIVGSAIELFSFFWRRHSFRTAGRWMILLGALLCVPTLFSGIFAYYDVATKTATNQSSWQAIKSSSSLTENQWHFLWDHTWQQIAATSLALLAALGWIAVSDRFRRKLQLVFLVILLAADFLMMAGAWHGGELVYRFGTAVEVAKAPLPEKEDHLIPTTLPTTTLAATTLPSTGPTTRVLELPLTATATAMTQPESPKKSFVQAAFPPVQGHVIFAGVTVALAALALSLSIRSWTSSDFETQRIEMIDATTPAEPGAPLATADLAATILVRPRVPSTRFWFLALLAAGITALLGDWLIAMFAGWHFKDLIDAVKAFPRRISHGVLAVAIVVLLLILGIISRYAPRQKMLISIFTLMLLIAVALQVRAGILLLYDGPEGPVMNFQ